MNYGGIDLSHPAALVLEDGSVFRGISIGAQSGVSSTTVGEVVFNTSLSGYQEILTDPSYTDQFIALTCPHIGNVGINIEDFESQKIYAQGLIIRQLPFKTSNWRQYQSLNEFLIAQNVVGIAEIDTRRLTQLIREQGAMKGTIITGQAIDDTMIAQGTEQAQAWHGLPGVNLAQTVTTATPYYWQGGGQWQPQSPFSSTVLAPPKFRVLAYDFGIKFSSLRQLHDLGCEILVVPANMEASEALSYQPDGIFLSNGPGDPGACTEAIFAVQAFLKAQIPLFGICLGHQLLALASGGSTRKMKFGHHGGNHPVKDLKQNKVMITSQNHGFVVDEVSLPAALTITHRSLFDQSIQGLRHKYAPALSFQGHPEAGPGPTDGYGLFDDFLKLMENHKLLSSTSSVTKIV